MIASPCINVCRMEGDVCMGCLRTLDEIARWREMSDHEKCAVLAAIEQRKPAAAPAR
jgi:hypothetical protein